MGADVDYLGLAAQTLAYLKALDPWFPNPEGADGEARVLAWGEMFARHKLSWDDIKSGVDTFTINAPSGAHAGIQDVIRGAQSARTQRISRNPHLYEEKLEEITRKSDAELFGLEREVRRELN